MELAPGRRVERYEVIERLGEGGMAVVYRVRHISLGTEHALKVLSHSGHSIRERLLQEGRLQATLRHPNLLPVTDVLEVDGSPGLLLDYVRGPSLEAWLLARRPSLEDALELFGQLLAGVEHAHDAGVVHRDLKPANVLIDLSGPEPVARVADFGLAKALGGSQGMAQTRTGVAMGTPSYMAPEQIRDAKAVDRRGDVFSLGAILYEMVCGRMAFVGQDMLEIFNAVASGNYVDPQALEAKLPHRVAQAIRGALCVNAEDRIQDCAALRRVLAGAEEWRAVVAGSTLSFDETPPGVTAARPATPAVDELPRGAPPLPSGLARVAKAVPARRRPAPPPPRPDRPPEVLGGTMAPQDDVGLSEPRPQRSSAPLAAFGGLLLLGGLAAVLAWPDPGLRDGEPELKPAASEDLQSALEVLNEPVVVVEEWGAPSRDPEPSVAPTVVPERGGPSPEPQAEKPVRSEPATKVAVAEPEPEPVAVEVEPEPEPEPEPVLEPEPALEPEPKARPVPANLGSVTAPSDVDLHLRSGQGLTVVVKAGRTLKMPAGNYQMVVRIGDQDAKVGSLDLGVGQDLGVSCSIRAQLSRCTAQPR